MKWKRFNLLKYKTETRSVEAWRMHMDRLPQICRMPLIGFLEHVGRMNIVLDATHTDLMKHADS